jgi:hypothetical protein
MNTQNFEVSFYRSFVVFLLSFPQSSFVCFTQNFEVSFYRSFALFLLLFQQSSFVCFQIALVRSHAIAKLYNDADYFEELQGLSLVFFVLLSLPRLQS